MGDLAFPGIVLLLKAATKLYVGRPTSLLDFIRALVALPIDITFLALSFGAALLYAMPPQTFQADSVKLMFVFLLCSILSTIVTVAYCRMGEAAIDREHYWWAVLHSTFTYFVALMSLMVALNIKGMI